MQGPMGEVDGPTPVMSPPPPNPLLAGLQPAVCSRSIPEAQLPLGAAAAELIWWQQNPQAKQTD